LMLLLAFLRRRRKRRKRRRYLLRRTKHQHLRARNAPTNKHSLMHQE
jgi:hypothetical protein